MYVSRMLPPFKRQASYFYYTQRKETHQYSESLKNILFFKIS
jgi:hypothetical protein